MTIRKCPKCGVRYKSHPTISRRDNKTEICPPCGTMEALKDLENYTLKSTKK